MIQEKTTGLGLRISDRGKCEKREEKFLWKRNSCGREEMRVL